MNNTFSNQWLIPKQWEDGWPVYRQNRFGPLVFQGRQQTFHH